MCKQMIIDKSTKHLQMNQIAALTNPERVDMPFKKQTKPHM